MLLKRLKSFVLAVLAVSIFASCACAATIGEFEIKTLTGDALTQEIFKDADLTMLNVWGTFCPPCLREMPALGELSRELKPQGVQIIGLVCDWTDRAGNQVDSQITKAKELVIKTGADYTHALLSSAIQKYLGNIFAVPQTYFVDAKGEIIASLTGARSKSQWEDVIFQLLEQVQR